MNARYRMVHYVPDPFVGARVPLAALVMVDGAVEVVKVPNIPGPACLGSRSRAAVASMILDDLTMVTGFDRLPPSIGPHALLDQAYEVPDGVRDVTAWLTNLLEGLSPAARAAAPEHHHAPPRSSLGYRFLEAYKVAQYVRKTFSPGHDLDGLLVNATTLGSISHYVPGKHDVLLMEPLIASRPQLKEDVRDVAKMFGAYKHAIRNAQLPRAVRPSLVAYVVGALTPNLHAAIDDGLAGFADHVYTVERKQPRREFLERVREVGETVTEGSLL